jgi:hypothetical protein
MGGGDASQSGQTANMPNTGAGGENRKRRVRLRCWRRFSLLWSRVPRWCFDEHESEPSVSSRA